MDMDMDMDDSDRAAKRRKVAVDETVPDSEEEDEYDSYDAGEDWDEVLASEEASNKAAEAIFSPSQQHRPPSQRQSASLSPLKARTDADAGERERDAMAMLVDADSEQINQNGNGDDAEGEGEEDADAQQRAHEAAVAAKYSTILQGFAARFPDQAQYENNETSHAAGDGDEAIMAGGPDTPAAAAHRRPPLVPATVSFTSARGKAFAPLSEAALRKAREFEAGLLDDSEDSEAAGAQHGNAGADTPILARTAAVGMAGRGMSAFRPPSRAASARPQQQHNHNHNQLVDTPTAAPAHRAFARPGLDPLRYALQNANANAAAAAAGAQGAGGFTSGSGAVVSMPSKADAEARMRSFESDRSGAQAARPAPKDVGLSLGGGGAFTMPAKASLEKEQSKIRRSDTDAAAEWNGDAGEGSGPIPFGLVTGSGKALKPPSKEAVARTAAMLSGTQPAPEPDDAAAVVDEFDVLGDDEDDEDLLAATAAAEEQVGAIRASQLGRGQGAGGFTSGSGAAVAMPDQEALKRAEALLDGSKSHAAAARPLNTPARPVLLAKNSNAMTMGAASPLRSAQQNAASKRGLLTGAGGAQTIATTPKLRQAFKPPRTVARPGTGANIAPATPTRTPGPGASSQLGPLRATQAAHPQLNLLMSPRNTPQTAPRRSTFKTPFKDGVRPSTNRLQELKHKSLEGSVRPGTLVGTAPAAVVAALEKEAVAPAPVNGSGKGKEKRQLKAGKDSVFDVYSTGSEPRKNMVEYGIDPSYRVNDLIDASLPPALIFLTFDKCELHRFDIGQGDTLGHEDAFEELVYYSACKGISLAWVKNHYALIVWKLAGIAKGLARSGGWREWWTFEKVCEQLKYRYEREVLLSQRSCIKRITERDSGSKAPMVLVVTRIIYEQREVPPEPGSDDAIQGITRTMSCPSQIELSDGWYRIRSSLLANDESLYRAVFYGYIYSGLKIAVQGAKLDSDSSDGAEPLEAYESCKLTITGNSTTRVPWHTKLGFQPKRKRPCVCSFRSLLPDGGFVPFIDVILTKLYPIGYKGPYVEGQTTDTWGETEEAERKRAWERERDKIVHDIQVEQQKAQVELRVIQQLLAEQLYLVSQRGPIAAKPEALPGLSDFSDVYQKLEDEPEKRTVVLKTLDKELLEETLQHAQRKAESFAFDCAEVMRKEVEERCPPRVAKSFRIVRLQDYSHGAAPAEGHDYNNRDCQLQITDLQKIAPGFLAEGKRYIIANLYPTNTNAWSRPDSKSGEILLCTRYDTNWFPMPL